MKVNVGKREHYCNSQCRIDVVGHNDRHGTAQGTVVTFEEPDIIVDTQANSVQVGPALFSDASLYSNPNHPQLFGSGTTGLSIDTETTTATIGSGQAFDFVGAAFGSTQIPWAVGCGGYCTMEASVTLRGLYQGAVMFSSTAAAPFLSSAFANLNWDGITALQVTYTVPPPG